MCLMQCQSLPLLSKWVTYEHDPCLICLIREYKTRINSHSMNVKTQQTSNIFESTQDAAVTLFPPLATMLSKSNSYKGFHEFCSKIKSLPSQGGKSMHLFATRGCCFISSLSGEVFFFFLGSEPNLSFLLHLLPGENPQIAKQHLKKALTSSEKARARHSSGLPSKRWKEGWTYHGYEHK